MTTTTNAQDRLNSSSAVLTARRRHTRGALAALALAVVATVATTGLRATPLAGARCDFNGDGFDDLALGVPGENVGSLNNAGAVNVIYGSSSGLTATGDQIWHQNRPSVAGVAAAGDAFGTSVACGHFNRDAYADLAVGVPGDDVNGAIDAGAVVVLYGSGIGLRALGSQLWHQDNTGVDGQAESGDRFGSALAAGDFDGDNDADLAIGAPNEDIGTAGNVGVVYAMYGGTGGLSIAGAQLWHQNIDSVLDEAGGDESFGAALAAGDFDADGFDDLAIGVPGEDIALADGSAADGGAVSVLNGSATGLSAARDRFLAQDTLIGDAESGDALGTSLAAGDFDHDGFDDLAIGVPGEDVGSLASAGAVNVVYGSASLLTAARNQIWHQNSASVEGVAEAGDAFGASVAAADLTGDGRADLIVGIPGEDVGNVANAGAVEVLRGMPSGLTATNSQILDQDGAYVVGVAESGDAFGSSVSAGDFDGNGFGDFVAGVPGEKVGTVKSAGAVNVFYGTELGLTGLTSEIWHQNIAGIEGAVGAYDRMGGQVVVSDGVYRLPYQNGKQVAVSGDLFTHSSDLYEYDLVGVGDPSDQYTVVAAALGVIMAIEDSNAEPTGSNNYVWIRHLNGEWTKYTHVETGSVTALGRNVGDIVAAGTPIGLEGDVGQANGEHVHFEVMVPDDPLNPISGGGYAIGHTRVPLICKIPGNVMYRGQTYTAGGC